MKRQIVIVIAAIVLGLIYGVVSGMRNQNPYYPNPDEYDVREEDMARAWHWEPSPIWLPSYLLCKIPPNGFGITHTRSGYLFKSHADRRLYLEGTMGLGGIMGALAGCLVLAATIKKKNVVEQLR